MRKNKSVLQKEILIGLWCVVTTIIMWLMSLTLQPKISPSCYIFDHCFVNIYEIIIKYLIFISILFCGSIITSQLSELQKISYDDSNHQEWMKIKKGINRTLLLYITIAILLILSSAVSRYDDPEFGKSLAGLIFIVGILAVYISLIYTNTIITNFINKEKNIQNLQIERIDKRLDQLIKRLDGLDLTKNAKRSHYKVYAFISFCSMIMSLILFIILFLFTR